MLVPNTLDFGSAPQALGSVLPQAVLHRAAQLQHWIVEDAKSARAFLKRVHEVAPLRVPLQALSILPLPRPAKGGRGPAGAEHDRAQAAAIERLLDPALAGHDIGVLSEAGLPAVADPGAAVVAAAHRLGLRVLPLAGPSSLMLALAASGLDGQSFAFVGYLPQEAVARCERIRELEGLSRRLRQTQIFIETPYRNPALMAALIECAAPATRISVSVALTLPEGWSRTATAAAWRKKATAATGSQDLQGLQDLAGLPDPATVSNRLPAVFLLQA